MKKRLSENTEGMELKGLEEREKTRFIDGSEYKGTWNVLGIEGIGNYVLPYGTGFQGELRDGTFHGHGSIYWTGGQRTDGVWSQGECKRNRYIFRDRLIFQQNHWKYCQFPDRRYHACLETGLRPAGATLRANQPNHILIIPSACYDSGIGIFDPRTYCITSYRDSAKVLEIPTRTMAHWIENNCRKGWTEPTGYRADLAENSYSQHTNLFAGSLPFSTNSFEPWWKRITTLQPDSIHNQSSPLFTPFNKPTSILP